MKPNLLSIIHILVCYFLSFGCTAPTDHEHEEEQAHQEETTDHDDHAGEENSVRLTDAQMAMAGVVFGNFDTLNTSGFVKSNGVLDLPPQNIAAISAPMAGFVKKANYLVGNHVRKGDVLAEMEHPDYLKIQEDYLTQVSRLDYLEAEWKRQQQLSSANIAAKKRYQEAEADYKVTLARTKSLEEQLRYIGLNPKEISKGNLSAVIYIRAPFSGYITQLNIHNGLFVQPEQELYEIIDIAHMHLELNVFEEDIHKIKVGQEIRFKVPSLAGKTYAGEVFLVGKSFDMEKKIVRVHGHIQGEHPEFIRGLYLDATIYTGREAALALPEEAVIRDEDRQYIFVAVEELPHQETAHDEEEEPAHEEDHEHAQESQQASGHEHEHEESSADHHHEPGGVVFQSVEVVTGISQNGLVEIKSVPDLPREARLVVQGAYDLFSEMKKGEGGHHSH